MNKLILITLTLALFSCKKICSVSSILCNGKVEKKEVIDFTQVDQYPQFIDCDTLLDYEESKTCFETTLHTKINNRVQNLKLNSDTTVTDTITIHFSIDKNGSFVYNKLKTSDSLLIILPNLEVEIQEIIHGFAKISPAQKRGIPVTTTYTIPLVIETY